MIQLYYRLWLALPILLSFLLTLFGPIGCQSIVGQDAAVEPTVTPTWPALPTTTPTIVPPTAPAALMTSASKPALPPAPIATPLLTPTPKAGYYGNPAIGFSFSYPSDWEVENNGAWIVVKNDDPPIAVVGQSALMDKGDTLDDYMTEIYKLVDNSGKKMEVITDTTTTLWDGAEARMTEFAQPGAPQKVRATLLTRGQRVFFVLIIAPKVIFDTFPETLAAISASMRIEEPRPYGISREKALFISGGQSDVLDPALTGGSSGSFIGAIFSGLVMLDEKLQIAPDLAERWEVSEDGKVYTFHLRRNAYFHDGKPVTAHDVKFSWERAADPKLESNTVETYLGDIVGVKAKFREKAKEIKGVEVVDDYTLRVTIDGPKVYFLAKLTYPTSFVVDKENVKTKDWQNHPNGTGPFRLLNWGGNSSIILKRNDDFYLKPAKLEYIVMTMYTDDPMQMYENDEIDMTGVSLNDLERVTDPTDPLQAELHTIPRLCTSRLIFDMKQPPFDDKQVRQAFAYAIDREKLTKVVLKGTSRPAYTILPPGMPGYNPDISAPHFDPEKAQQLLADSSYGNAKALPEITFTTSGLGNELSSSEAALVDMWRTNLGVEVKVEQLEPDTFNKEIHHTSHGQLISLGWCADYPDPENFLDILYHSGSRENIGRYNNPNIDKLLEQARVETNLQTRLTLYHRIEQMIIDDTPDILLGQGQSYLLIKPYVKNYLLNPIDQAIEWRLLAVERRTD